MGAERISESRVKQALRRSGVRRAVIWRRHRGLRPSDVFIASYPRSGNTWLRFVLTEVASDQPSTFRSVEELAPAVGYHRDAPALARDGGRLIKTHEPYRREYRRGIYLVRDVRDVVMSYYRMHKATKFPDITLDGFMEDFARGRADGYGTWERHVRSWTSDRDPSADVLVLRYEDMRREPEAHIRAAAEFAGISVSEERLRAALERNSLEGMRAREQHDAEWAEQRLGWKIVRPDIERSHDWRAELDESHLAALRPAQDVLRQFDYAT